MSINLNGIDTDLDLRTALKLIQENFNKLSGLDERVDDLGQKYGQLWTGVNVAGDVTHPGSGAEIGTNRWYDDVYLGNTSDTYTDWIPTLVGSGFTVWRIAPTDYRHNEKNNLYMDDQPLVNEGLASSVALAAFAKVFTYNGAVYTDVTAEAGTEYGTEFELLADTNDYLYCGAAAVFAGVSFNFHTPGIGHTIKAEYYNGATWETLADTDTTSDFSQNGSMEWTIPGTWATVAVNGSTQYWVRFSTTAAPDRVAAAYSITPTTSVVAMVQLSSDDLTKKNYRWCSYGAEIYAALPSDGDPDYDGINFVRSGSSLSNRQSYFASNHSFRAFYESATWTGGYLSVARRLEAHGI